MLAAVKMTVRALTANGSCGRIISNAALAAFAEAPFRRPQSRSSRLFEDWNHDPIQNFNLLARDSPRRHTAVWERLTSQVQQAIRLDRGLNLLLIKA